MPADSADSGVSNPFLISAPPPAPTPEPAAEQSLQTAATTEPAETDTAKTDPADFITLPPGIVDSATFRVAAPRSERVTTRPPIDEIVFFPAAPGVPPAAVWHLVIPSTGSRIILAPALFVGRNPIQTDDRADAALLPLDDPARSLSKTHALLEWDEAGAWVTDLASTNGVVIVHGDDVVDVEQGIRTPVKDGADVELGEFVIRIERGLPS